MARDEVADHFRRLKAAVQARTVVLASRTSEPFTKIFALVIFEAPDRDAAERFMSDDPTVSRDVMTAELHPHTIAVLGRPSH